MNLHHRLILLGFLACLAAGASPLGAQAPNFTSHYPAGVEGVKGGTLPPPGLYWRHYNLFYHSDHLRVEGLPPGFDYDVTAFVTAPRLVWITNFRILGGFYGADVLVPFGWVDQDDSLGFSGDKSGIGDIFIEPITLSWHPEQWDLGVGYGMWAPTGDHDPSPGEPPLIWKGYWSHMFTAGATRYLDAGKTLSVSILNRYEIPYENHDLDITPGHAYTMEWGVSKAFTKTFEAGVAGYWQQQVTRDANSPNDSLDRVFGIGPELNLVIPRIGLFASARYLFEFGARDRPEGRLLSVTLTKRF